MIANYLCLFDITANSQSTYLFAFIYGFVIVLLMYLLLVLEDTALKVRSMRRHFYYWRFDWIFFFSSFLNHRFCRSHIHTYTGTQTYKYTRRHSNMPNCMNSWKMYSAFRIIQRRAILCMYTNDVCLCGDFIGFWKVYFQICGAISERFNVF